MKQMISRSVTTLLLLCAFAAPLFASEDNDNNNNYQGNSLRGFYEGSLSGGGKAVFYVADNQTISAYILDTAGQQGGYGNGTLNSNGAFTITLSNGSTVNGTATAATSSSNASISATYSGQTITAARVATFGRCDSVAGRFTGTATSSSSTLTDVTFLIDSQGNIFFVANNGTSVIAGFGTVTLNQGASPTPTPTPTPTPSRSDDDRPRTTSLSGTFNITLVSGQSVTGTFSVNNGSLSATFTYNGQTYTFGSNRDSVSYHLANISTRALVSTGQGQLIGGFIIRGGPKLVLIRAIGPSLTAQGITSPLANPKLQLFQGSTLLATNDDWQTNANASDIKATTLAPTNSLESALLVRLEPGFYTTVVTGSDGGTGIALVEIYEADRD